MEKIIKQAAAEMGRKGGKSTSPAKAEAARINGRKGGRPPMKQLRKETNMKKISLFITEATSDWMGSIPNGAQLIIEGFKSLYDEILQQTKEKFTSEELQFLQFVMNSDWLEPGKPGIQIIQKLEDVVFLDEETNEELVGDPVLIEKILNLSPFERCCLEIWATS